MEFEPDKILSDDELRFEFKSHAEANEQSAELACKEGGDPLVMLVLVGAIPEANGARPRNVAALLGFGETESAKERREILYKFGHNIAQDSAKTIPLCLAMLSVPCWVLAGEGKLPNLDAKGISGHPKRREAVSHVAQTWDQRQIMAYRLTTRNGKDDQPLIYEGKRTVHEQLSGKYTPDSHDMVGSFWTGYWSVD